ncbi:hypothetical protein CWC12_16200 [Pseudoalteromonas ruthenica]|uniref:Uncharacterized protein n=1 Tax=Pseudoalteromonas ruthenica TaxID=151081 RepID=A0A0F4Q0P4_9GAMM|nr:hypothetical protein TW76_01410 [Pseudoalteromonas ruthenica]QFU04284.1 hypothetical protein FIU82_04520 [Pseudoalteromonas sp. THAF3]RZF80684.1 hypothetical protein EXT46_11780 [Pseudoalteromonas sp. CO325X]GAP74846.1 hypothetical protein W04_1364 [Pseudoalteromonas sp. SW0106-04]KJZ01063.1 hypothetical protein TW72_04195 [Pseudoalteromonas ruthenica]
MDVNLGIQILLGALAIGAFFISHGRLLRIGASVAIGLLFFVHAQQLVTPNGLTNISLVLINTFYLFKVYTQRISGPSV